MKNKGKQKRSSQQQWEERLWSYLKGMVGLAGDEGANRCHAVGDIAQGVKKKKEKAKAKEIE